MKHGTIRCFLSGVVTRLVFAHKLLKEPVVGQVCEQIWLCLNDVANEKLLVLRDSNQALSSLFLLRLRVLRGQPTNLNCFYHRFEHTEDGLIGHVMLTNLFHVLTQQVLS